MAVDGAPGGQTLARSETSSISEPQQGQPRPKFRGPNGQPRHTLKLTPIERYRILGTGVALTTIDVLNAYIA